MARNGCGNPRYLVEAVELVIRHSDNEEPHRFVRPAARRVDRDLVSDMHRAR